MKTSQWFHTDNSETKTRTQKEIDDRRTDGRTDEQKEKKKRLIFHPKII